EMRERLALYRGKKAFHQTAAQAEAKVVVTQSLTPSSQVRDQGKFFGARAISEANDQIADFSRRAQKTLLIETFPGVLPEDAERVEAMNKEERGRFFHDWAGRRVAAEKVHGIYILVCRQPSHFQLVVSADTRPTFDDQA